MESKENNKSQAEINDGRRKIMTIGVVVLMVVIVVFWIFNIKSFVNPYSEKLLITDQKKLEWNDLKGKFDETMSQMVSKMNALEARKELAADTANASSSLNNLENILNAKVVGSSTSSGAVGTSSSSQGSELKARLNDIEKNLEKN